MARADSARVILARRFVRRWRRFERAGESDRCDRVQLINYRHSRALTRVETDLSVSSPQPGDLPDFAPADRHTSLRALLCRTIRGPGGPILPTPRQSAP